jgi:hypothetical protein
MIIRALFAAVLIALFVPHEPDIGLGRPGPRPQLVTLLANIRHLYIQGEAIEGFRLGSHRITYRPESSPYSAT